MRLEGAGVAVSATGTVDLFGTETYADNSSHPFVFRLNQDGTGVDGGSSFHFWELWEGRAAGIVAGDDGCFIIGKGFYSGEFNGHDIFVAEYGSASVEPEPVLDGGSRISVPAKPAWSKAAVDARVVQARH